MSRVENTLARLKLMNRSLAALRTIVERAKAESASPEEAVQRLEYLAERGAKG